MKEKLLKIQKFKTCHVANRDTWADFKRVCVACEVSCEDIFSSFSATYFRNKKIAEKWEVLSPIIHFVLVKAQLFDSIYDS